MSFKENLERELNQTPIICSDCGEVAFSVECSPGRPAPPCSNPDSPAYSDPGEGVAIGEHPDICSNCGAPVSDQYVEDQVLGYLEEKEESSYEDAQSEYEPEDDLDDDPWMYDREDDDDD